MKNRTLDGLSYSLVIALGFLSMFGLVLATAQASWPEENQPQMRAKNGNLGSLVGEEVTIITTPYVFVGVVADADMRTISLNCATAFPHNEWDGQSAECQNNPNVWDVSRTAIVAIGTTLD